LVQLTFYGGVNEIGGNKVFLEDADTRIFIDFGMSFGRKEQFYAEYLAPRTANGLGDFLEMGLLPDLPGLYRDDLLSTVGRKPEEPQYDAVLLSHAHLDHSAYISFLHEKIPVYCGETCLLILQALHEAGSRNIETELLDFKERPIIDRKKPAIKREFRTFRTGQKLKVGTLEIEPIHVDHSIPGNYGFIIHTTQGAVVYTSDVRMHGTKPEMTTDFIDTAKKARPVALISEGTRIDLSRTNESESRVKNHCSGLVKETNRLVAADFNFKDVDRFRTFYTIAKESERKLAVTFGDAFLLKYLSKDPKLGVPPPDDDNIVIMIPKRGTGRYQPEDYDKDERQFLTYPNAWTAGNLRNHQTKLLAHLSFYNMGELIDIKPENGTTFIHSLSEPFNEESLIDYRRLHNWLKHFHMTFIQSHASGHATGDEIKQMIKEIEPGILFPIHTEHPQMLQGITRHTELVTYGEPVTL
jgi:ribonuclease J